MSCVVSTYLESAFDCCCYHATYVFQSESTLYSWLNVKELSRLNDWNWTRIHNHLVDKRILYLFAKLGQMIELCFEYLSFRWI